MRFRALPVLALLTGALLPAGAAHATPTTGPDGLRCGAVSVADPGTEGGDAQTGSIFGGPLVVTDPATGFASGTLRCTIQVFGRLHSDSDNGASASADGDSVVMLPPTLISYVSPPNVQVYVCTQFTYDTGEVFYWGGGTWTTSAATSCDAMRTVVADPEDALDSVVCPIFSSLPVFGSTLRNLWGCDRVTLPFSRGYVLVPTL